MGQFLSKKSCQPLLPPISKKCVCVEKGTWKDCLVGKFYVGKKFSTVFNIQRTEKELSNIKRSKLTIFPTTKKTLGLDLW